MGMFELDSGGLGWKFAGGLIFGQKMVHVFVVVGWRCGEGEGVKLWVLER